MFMRNVTKVNKNTRKREEILSHLNACKIVRDGAEPELPAGAFNFSSTTRTILHRNSKFNNIEIQTGATSTFVYGLSSIQHLAKESNNT